MVMTHKNIPDFFNVKLLAQIMSRGTGFVAIAR